MESHRFDILTRHLAAARGRRQAIATLAASALPLLFRGMDPDEVAAKCKGYKGKCKKSSSCCDHVGLQCRNDRCRCKKGWKRCSSSGKGCTHVKADPDNCGSCGNECPLETPCCINGSCQEMCGGSCCADCYVDFLNGIPQPLSETCCGAGAGTFCSAKKHDKSDDQCCYPDQECIKGECCADGKLGTVICGGQCCASAACCNGKCCPDEEVCGMTTEGLACVAANRDCDNDADCLDGEVCHSGVCCAGDRVCEDGMGGDFCCPAGEYCDNVDPVNTGCCDIGTRCQSTWRSRRVRK